MTQLRDRMLEELERRNYAPGTAKAYLFAVQQFAEHFHRPPDRLGAEHIRLKGFWEFSNWEYWFSASSKRMSRRYPGALRKDDPDRPACGPRTLAERADGVMQATRNSGECDAFQLRHLLVIYGPDS